jgi:hypothetical protein
MPDATTPTLDPTIGTTPVTLPEQDECCQAPCDPPWRKPSCVVFTETKTFVTALPTPPRTNDFGRAQVTITVTYEHRLCLVGKQHGGLAYTLTLLPGEKVTLYQSDRFRRTTSETTRVSVQTTFSQFVSALHQQRNTNDTTALNEVLKSASGSSVTGGGIGIATPLGVLGAGGGSESSSSTSSVNELLTQSSSDQFVSVAQQASLYTDAQRSVTVSSFEDSETVSTTQRTLVNNNLCHAVNYFVRKVLDVYEVTTRVTAVTFQVTAGKFVSPVLTPDQLGQIPGALRAAVAALLKTLPKVGESVQQPTVLAVPTDGVVYDPELSHCCSQDPELEQATRIRLEREQAEAQRIGLEVQLMALEVQRRQALLAQGVLDAFEAVPSHAVHGA